MKKYIAFLLAILALASYAGAEVFNTVKQRSYLVNEDGTRAMVNVIDEAHFHIHEGKHFTWSNSSSLNSGQGIVAMMTTNASGSVHMFVKSGGTGGGAYYVYEDVTNSTSGGVTTSYNRNRQSGAVTRQILTIGNTITNYGTELYSEKFGSGPVTGGDVRSDNEFILKKNTRYLFSANSTSASNLVSLILDWYIEEDQRQ